MAGHFLEFTDAVDEQFWNHDNSNVVTQLFNTGQQNHAQQISDISKQPMVVDVDPFTLGKKEQLFGYHTLNKSGLGILNQQPPVSINTAQDPLQSITLNDQDEVGSQDIICKKVLIIQDQEFDSVDDHEGQGTSEIETALCDGKFIQDHVVTQIHDDEALLELLGGKENKVEFVAMDSEKRRNPPYLIKDTRITTKNEEPVKFCLTGAQPCQMVSVTMRYTEEKYKNTPVSPCLMHKVKTSEEKFNFWMSVPVDSDGNCRYDIINDHPTANLMLNANMLDLNNNFVFSITMKCLNSCHKENGKKMELIFKLKDPSEDGILQENHFEIRVCKNVKRDYKEACEEEESVMKKRMKLSGDTFITPPVEVPQATPICKEEEAKPQPSSANPVQVQLLSPAVEDLPKPQESKVIVKCKTAKAAEIAKPKFYFIQLPTLEKEKNVLDTVRLYGGKVLYLESVIPEEDDDDDNETDL